MANLKISNSATKPSRDPIMEAHMQHTMTKDQHYMHLDTIKQLLAVYEVADKDLKASSEQALLFLVRAFIPAETIKPTDDK